MQPASDDAVAPGSLGHKGETLAEVLFRLQPFWRPPTGADGITLSVHK